MSREPRLLREPGGVFVLFDVRALELPRAVHRDEPAADAAEEARWCCRCRRRPHRASRLGFAPELVKQPDDELAVMPLLGFDDPDPLPLRRDSREGSST